MRKKYLIAGSIITIVTVMTFGVYWLKVSKSIENDNMEDKPIQEVVMKGDRARYYDNLESLMKDSEYIVEVTMDKERESFDWKGVPSSIIKAKINEVIKGESNKLGDEINILETGGIINNKLYTFEDDKLLECNQSYILFIYKFDMLAQGKECYITQGINQGKFKINKANDIIETIGEHNDLKNKLKNLSPEEFKKIIKK